ncbi:ExeA family protein [Pseudohongiella acticola]|uniref:ExeA family protein n=1 Tax=Pseudohongiella acticola TaxID=1524254 RepID=UPI0030EECB7B
MAAPNTVTHIPGATLMLKRVMFRLGVSQVQLHRVVGIPTSTLCEIINHNNWPTNHDHQMIRRATEEHMLQCGASTQDIKTLWQFDEDDTPVTYHGHLVRMRKANPVVDSSKKTAFINEELPENEMLSQKAKQLFKLFNDPFIDDVTCPDDVFMSPDQQYVRGAMYQTAKRGGFIAVVGESGAGKTTLRRDLLDRINREDPNIRVVFPRIIDKSRINASSICDAILADMDVRPKSSLEAKARQIEVLLSESARGGNAHVIMIEEAHDVPIQTLKFMKRFWELEDGFKKLISIILVGQPELKNTLNEHIHPEIREVSRRCEIIELQPLNGNLEKYLELKFKRVGRSLADIFEKDAFDAIRARLSVHRGTSRVPVNMMYPLIVNNCVTAAMNSCAELGMAKINAELIKEL